MVGAPPNTSATMSARCRRAGTSRAVADRAEHEGEMLHAVEGRDIGVAGRLAGLRLDRKGRDALDELLARLPIGDEIGDRDQLEAVRGGEVGDLLAGHHRAVVIGEFADDADRRQAGEAAEVDGRFRMAGAHQHAAVPGDQREDMAGPHEIAPRPYCRWRARAPCCSAARPKCRS